MSVTMSKPLTARYATRCKRCNEVIEAGETIKSFKLDGKKLWAHVGCAASGKSESNGHKAAEKPEPKSPDKGKASKASDHSGGEMSTAAEVLDKTETNVRRASSSITVSRRLFALARTLVTAGHPEYDRLVKLESTFTKLSSGGEASATDEAAIRSIVENALANAKPAGGDLDWTSIRTRIGSEVAAKFAEVSGKLASDAHAAAMAFLGDARKIDEERIAKAIADLETKRQVEIVVKRPDLPDVTLPDCPNPVFADVLFHASCGDNIMLVGPTGCGKTKIAGDVADSLGMKFSFVSCSVGLTESAILGTREPNDNGGFEYRASAFLEGYEGGDTLFLWDEVDALDPNVFMCVNAANANGKMSVPKRFGNTIAKRGKNFLCMCAANTYGTGADRKYVGRNPMDLASRDRFVIITMDYNRDYERLACPDTALLDRLWKYRKAIEDNRLERALSTRFVQSAATWKKLGKTDEYIDSKLFEGWRPDEVRKVRGY